MEFSRQEYWSGLPLPLPGYLNPTLPVQQSWMWCFARRPLSITVFQVFLYSFWFCFPLFSHIARGVLWLWKTHLQMFFQFSRTVLSLKRKLIKYHKFEGNFGWPHYLGSQTTHTFFFFFLIKEATTAWKYRTLCHPGVIYSRGTRGFPLAVCRDLRMCPAWRVNLDWLVSESAPTRPCSDMNWCHSPPTYSCRSYTRKYS